MIELVRSMEWRQGMPVDGIMTRNWIDITMNHSRMRAFLSGVAFWIGIAVGVLVLSGLYEWLEPTFYR